MSLGRSTPRSRSATATQQLGRRRRGPALSLTALKSSRSTKSTATGVALPVRAGQGLLEPVGEQARLASPVSASWKALCWSCASSCLLRGDVAGGDDDGADVGVVQQVGVDALHVAVAAVPVPQPQVGGRAGLVAGDGLGPGGEEGQPVLGVGEIGELRADQLVLRVAEQPGDRRRLIGDRQVGVDQGDQVGGVVHQRLEARLAPRRGRRDALLRRTGGRPRTGGTAARP